MAANFYTPIHVKAKTMGSLFDIVLPVEMWRMILLQIDDSTDLRNISKCSLYFRELLLKRRVYFLAPKVFEILLQRTTGKQLECIEENVDKVMLEIYFMKTDENLKDDILNCRLVCSGWNKAVETCYEQPLMTGITALSTNVNLKLGFCKPYAWNMQRFCFYFQPEKASRFLQTFEQSHFTRQQKNPFLGRLVHFEVTLSPVNEEIDFLLAVENILRTFGREVWFAYLIVTSKRGYIGPSDYLKVAEYIGCLPNLRYLYLRLNTFYARNLTVNLLDQHPLKKLKNLIALEVCDLNGPVLNEIISKNSHVLYFGMHRQHNLIGQVSDAFTNLNGISVTCVNESNHQIINWIGAQYKLEVLQLQQRCEDFNMSLNFEHFKKHFYNTLQDLTLELLFPVNQRQLYLKTRNLRLDLPQLRRLSIQFSGLHSIDFIYLLKGLEMLELLLVPKEHIVEYEFYQRLIVSEKNYSICWI